MSRSRQIAPLRDLLVNRNVSRCHAVPPTPEQVRFDGRIIRLSRLLRSLASSFSRRRWHFIPSRLHLAAKRPRACHYGRVNARYSLSLSLSLSLSSSFSPSSRRPPLPPPSSPPPLLAVSFSEVQALDISRYAAAKVPTRSARRYYLSPSLVLAPSPPHPPSLPPPSPPVRGRERERERETRRRGRRRRRRSKRGAERAGGLKIRS